MLPKIQAKKMTKENYHWIKYYSIFYGILQFHLENVFNNNAQHKLKQFTEKLINIFFFFLLAKVLTKAFFVVDY